MHHACQPQANKSMRRQVAFESMQATTALTAAAVLLSTSATSSAFLCSERSEAGRRNHRTKSRPPPLSPLRPTTSCRHTCKLQRRERSQNSLSLGEVFPIKVVVLQHCNEVGRRSATAPLLFGGDGGGGDTGTCTCSGGDISRHLSAKRWTWSGRKDNEAIQKLIEETEKSDGIGPALLWTGSGGDRSFSRNTDDDCALHCGTCRAITCSYIVLDGTWKEARAMFRKMPFLQRLPRISFEGGRWETQYSLRSDYSNWRERFSRTNVSGDGDDDSGSDLLCTAESVAALLDLNGDEEGGDLIRHRLHVFQDEYMYR
jgi:hypothetical protein